MDGIILIDKPENVTSFQVCELIKKKLKVRKVGHGGTLDPFSTGLLIIGINKGTRLLNFFLEEKKEYTGIIEFGKETDTFDVTGNIIREEKVNLKEEEILKAVEDFKGVINQTPPPFSAVKHKGKPLYKYAREGKIIKKPERQVFIEAFEILKFNLPEIEFKIVCSKGTYIRSIAHDLGKKLGTCAYLKKLRRTAIGNYRVDSAYLPDEVTEESIIPFEDALNFPKLYVKPEYYRILKNGGIIRKEYIKNIEDSVKNGYVYLILNGIIAIAYTENGKIFKPKMVYLKEE